MAPLRLSDSDCPSTNGALLRGNCSTINNNNRTNVLVLPATDYPKEPPDIPPWLPVPNCPMKPLAIPLWPDGQLPAPADTITAADILMVAPVLPNIFGPEVLMDKPPCADGSHAPPLPPSDAAATNPVPPNIVSPGALSAALP